MGILICIGGATGVHAQTVTLSGKVYNSVTRQAVDFGVVISFESRTKARIGADGSYRLELPEAGTYTLMVRAAGLRPLKLKYAVRGTSTRDFYLRPLRVAGGTLRVFGDRNIQKVSRYTMTSQDIKDVPAAFGDSISALTALPGVNRTGGFFGPLVIRSADPVFNRYYFDDIPLLTPQHFGGIHSVINSNLLREVDLYSSAFPAQFGGANAAVINMNSVDTVKEFSGYADIGLISANAIFKVPFFRDVNGSKKKETAGYLIVSGRYGYYRLLIPLFYKIFTGDTLTSVPEYWDYQVKGRYYFNSRLWMTFTAIGNRDFFRILGVDTDDQGFDPLTNDFDLETDTLANAQALYLTWQPGPRFRNRLMTYASLNDTYFYINLNDPDAADWAKDFFISSEPYIFGVKDKLKFEWLKDHAELRLGAELTYYYFSRDGVTLVPQDYNPVQGIPNFANETEFYSAPLDAGAATNLAVGGYLENEFNVWGLKFVPGMHYDFLNRTKEHLVDFRGLLSYEFKSNTTVSAAGGQYSSFLQTNPTLFNNAPDIATLDDEIKPFRSLHSSLGLEQVIDLWTVKAEGFFNYFYDVTYSSAAVANNYLSEGKMYTYGVEIMARLDRRKGQSGFFGWVNYTWARARSKSNLPLTADPYGDQWITSDYEQEHTVKLVAGYTSGRHSISTRFQLNTSLPYTPVSGSVVSGEFPDGSDRHVPIYDDSIPNSANLPMEHRLDVRYTHKTSYAWGYVSWYIEVINIYMFKASDQDWDYSEPYGDGTNPQIKKQGGLNIIPNFGVEIKF